MRTFLLPEDFSPRNPLTVTGERFHYLTRVLRLAAGDRISGTDREGSRYLLRISELHERSLVLETERAVNDSEAAGIDTHSPRIHLFQALLKGKKMDTVIRQAVEAGVQRIVPIVSDHAVPRYEDGRVEKKRRRWETVVREAVQQSGSRVVSEVVSPVEMSRITEHWNREGPGLFFHQDPLEQSALHRYLSHYPSDVAVAVGPEGGFSDAEIELLRAAGFSPVLLQTNVLRAETAAVYAIGAVQTILTERRFWSPQ